MICARKEPRRRGQIDILHVVGIIVPLRLAEELVIRRIPTLSMVLSRCAAAAGSDEHEVAAISSKTTDHQIRGTFQRGPIGGGDVSLENGDVNAEHSQVLR